MIRPHEMIENDDAKVMERKIGGMRKLRRYRENEKKQWKGMRIIAIAR